MSDDFRLPAALMGGEPSALGDSRQVWDVTTRPAENDIVVPPPEVTALMVVTRPELARAAIIGVNAFLGQTYGRKKLVVLNATDKPVTDRQHPLVSEWMIKAKTRGEALQQGLERIDSPWVLVLPPDVCAHNGLVSHLMAHRVGGHSVQLGSNVRVDYAKSVVSAATDENGFVNVLLFPRADDVAFDPASDASAVAELLRKSFVGRRVVVPTLEVFPGPYFLIDFFHPLHDLPADVFHRGIRPLAPSPTALKYLEDRLRPYKIEIALQKPS